MNSEQIALITGATSGIGEATALLLAQNGFKIVACGRNNQKLSDLQKQLGKEICYTTSFDVTDKTAVQQAVSSLPSAWLPTVLINNAGNAFGMSTIQNGDSHDWDQTIDLNIKGLLYVSEAIMPILIKKGKGHIVNMGSIAGQQVYPKGNVYCATKFAVKAISDAMRIDLNSHSIKVTEIRPGAVETNFSVVRFKGDKQKADNVYKGYTPLYAQDIADTILYAVTRPPHVQISELTVLPTAQASATVFNKN